MSLANITWIAFELPTAENLAAPGWMGDLRFDIAAKIPHGATREQLFQMLQNMLGERFGLKYHKEERETRGYRLVVAKSGTKFREAAAEPAKDSVTGDVSPPDVPAPPALSPDGFPAIPPGKSGLWITANRARGRWHHAPIQELAEDLGYRLRSPVLDATGLNGRYYLDLYWVVDPEVEAGAGPSLFRAVEEQLGLRLVVSKVRTPVVVIDHAERVPREN